MDHILFIHSFIHQWTLGLLPPLAMVNKKQEEFIVRQF